MAFRTQKISQMTPKGANLEATDLIEVSTIESGSYVTRSITGQEIIDAAVGNVDWGDIGGTLSNQTDLQNALDAKVPTSRTLTINGVTQDLSANRTFTISTGITIGSTAIASGVVGRVLFEGAGNVVQESSSLFWDNTNARLGIGTSTPSNPLHLLSATNAAFFAKVQNTNGGSSASAGYEIQSNTAYGSIFATPSAYAPFGVLNASQIGFYSTNTFAIAIDSATSDFRIGTGLGATERMRIFSTGNVAINTTTDAGFRLDVNGTARVSGLLTTPSGINLAGWYLYANGTSLASIYGGSNWVYTVTSGGSHRFLGGNLLINTTTDAGYKLDVNGTARVSGSELRVGNLQMLTSGSPGATGQGITTTGRKISFQAQGEINADFTSAYQLLGYADGTIPMTQNATGRTMSFLQIKGGFSAPNFNNTNANVVWMNPVYNMSGTSNAGQILRGIYYNPTLTDLTNATHYAFHSTSGLIRFENLPTSSAGLPAGTLYNNLGVLMIA